MATVFKQRVQRPPMLLFVSEAALVVAAIASAILVVQHYGTATSGLVPKALLIALAAQTGVYFVERSYRRATAGDAVTGLLQSLCVTSFVLGLLVFWFPSAGFGQDVMAAATALVFALVLGWRVTSAWSGEAAEPLERLLLVGTGPSMITLARELLTRRDLRVKIVGFVDPDPANLGRPVVNPSVIGTLDDIPELVERHRVNRVVVSLPEARGRLPIERLIETRLKGVRFNDLASAYEKYTGKIAIENLRPSWLIFSDGFRRSRSLEIAKRCLDIVAASIGLVLSAPLMALVVAGIKLSSPGPALFHQVRVGLNGHPFVLHKFRSMRVNAEAETGPVWSREGDNRVYPFGRFLRRTRLDELPQLWNVLRGELSLVGPRPERPEFVAELTRQIPFYGQRHSIKPGVTGWAQVCGPYASSVEDAMEKLQWDLFYVKNVSIALDLLIMLKTVKTVLLRRGT